MKSRLPSTGSLRAFEASARHLSFTRAATELNLTQTAVSHQIRLLERQLGAQLFIRESGGITLTGIGREYLGRIRPALYEISDATNRAMELSNESSLVVASLGTFAIKCLLPNLHSFRERHPAIKLRLVIADSFDAIDPNTYDVAIRYGIGDWPGMQVTRLTREEGFPVCSPGLMEDRRGWQSPRDLLAYTIIRLDSPMLRDFWPLWFEAAGMKDVVFNDEMLCNRLSVSIQAAINGVGVAIARSSVAQPDLDAGLLIEPFSLRVSAGAEGYYLLSSREKADARKVQAFCEWSVATLSLDGGLPRPGGL